MNAPRRKVSIESGSAPALGAAVGALTVPGRLRSRFASVARFRRCTSRCGLLLVFALAASAVQSQPVFTVYRSIEARVGEAETVIRGGITSLSRTVVVPPGGHSQDDPTIRPDGIVEYAFTVTADEVLKGPPCKTLQFTAQTDAFDKRYDEWADQRTPFLWFVGKGGSTGDRAAPGGPPAAVRPWSMLRLGAAVPGERKYSSGIEGPVFAMDFTRLAGPDETVARAREFARQGRGFVKTHTFQSFPQTPGQVPPPTLWAGLVVPVTPALQTTAHRLIQQNAVIEGVKALVYFRSKENITLLKSLLGDPTAWERKLADESELPVRLREYVVRKEACAVLRGWGVKFAPPVLQTWVPSERVYRKAELPEYGDTAAQPNSKVQYYFKRWFVATSDYRKPPWLYRSENGGETWTLWCVEFRFKALFIHPETGVLYAVVEAPSSLDDPAGFFHGDSGGDKLITSTDGKQWKDITPGRRPLPNIVAFTVDPDHPRRVCVYAGFSTGSNLASNEAFVLQPADDRCSKWKWYLAGDWDQRKQKPPLHTE